MATTIIRAGLLFIGIAAILIASAIALLGINLVGQFFAGVINFVYDAGPMMDLGQPNDDSELRFYSVFFIAYGIIMVQTAQNLRRHGHRIPFLLAVFFAGGLARALSYVTIGQPHALFILLMIIELTLPPLLYWAWRRARPNLA